MKRANRKRPAINYGTAHRAYDNTTSTGMFFEEMMPILKTASRQNCTATTSMEMFTFSSGKHTGYATANRGNGHPVI